MKERGAPIQTMSPELKPIRTSTCVCEAVCWFASMQVGKLAKMTRLSESCRMNRQSD